jgi:hypothetical protein
MSAATCGCPGNSGCRFAHPGYTCRGIRYNCQTAMRMHAGILAARNARALHDFRPSRGERAQGKPGADCTRGPRATKSTGVGPQVNRSNAGFPCAVVYGLLRALPGDRAFLPPSSARCASIVANLNASIGAPGPHDFAVRDIRRSSLAVSRVHRIPPRVRDVRNAPLVGRDVRIEITDLPDDGSGIFLREGMDRLLVICPSG